MIELAPRLPRSIPPSVANNTDVLIRYISVKGFARGKAKLNKPMKKLIRSELDGLSGVKRIVCTGTVRGNTWTATREALALARAKAGCNYVSTLSPNNPVELRKRLISTPKGNPLTVRIRVFS